MRGFSGIGNPTRSTFVHDPLRPACAGQQVSLDQRVTNIYRREAGSWKIVHHHTGVSPAMLDVLKRLQANT